MVGRIRFFRKFGRVFQLSAMKKVSPILYAVRRRRAAALSAAQVVEPEKPAKASPKKSKKDE